MLKLLLQVEMRHVVLRDFRHVFQIPCVEAQMGLAFCWPGIGYGLWTLRFEEQRVEASSRKFPDFRRAGVSSQSAASCQDHAFWVEEY